MDSNLMQLVAHATLERACACGGGESVEVGQRASTFRDRELDREHAFDVANKFAVVGLDASLEARDLLAVATDKVFVKVPFRALPGTRHQLGIQRIGLDAADARFLEHGKL